MCIVFNSKFETSESKLAFSTLSELLKVRPTDPTEIDKIFNRYFLFVIILFIKFWIHFMNICNIFVIL